MNRKNGITRSSLRGPILCDFAHYSGSSYVSTLRAISARPGGILLCGCRTEPERGLELPGGSHPQKVLGRSDLRRASPRAFAVLATTKTVVV